MHSPKTSKRHNIKLIIAYFGAPYAGWQKTKLGPTIEEILEQTLAKILQHEVKLQAASRTDAGVHAEGQVVNFFMDSPFNLGRLKISLNGLLPKDIAIVHVEEMPIHFHPTLDNVKKEYWYHICNGPFQLPFYRQTSWHFPYPIDKEAMCKASEHLLRSHDFSAFCNERPLWTRDPICTLEKIEITTLPGQRFRIAMTSDRFLFRMARNLAGTLASIGSLKLKTDILSILKSKDRTQAGVTAPAHGLTLKQVFYDFSQ
jgi:tRNA pseudouridine38-40 synthase